MRLLLVWNGSLQLSMRSRSPEAEGSTVYSLDFPYCFLRFRELVLFLLFFSCFVETEP